MKRTLTYEITAKDAGHTIETFLRAQGFSKQNLTNLKKMTESVLVDGDWKHMNYVLQLTDILEIHILELASSTKLIPTKIPLDVVYEDADLLVVNKPADMPVHISMGNYENTLANAVAWYYEQKQIPFVFRCVNRLDRNTTGLTIIAKHMLSANLLSKMIAQRKIHREYLAIVQDEQLPDFGTVHAPIGRREGSCIERTVDFNHGERAVTHYQVLGRENGYAFISLHLETGRTHQIRVHMNYLNCPLAGDSLYNSREISYLSGLQKGQKDNRILKRQALHSYRLEFVHPLTGESLCFTCPLPEDMTAFLVHHMPFACKTFQQHHISLQ